MIDPLITEEVRAEFKENVVFDNSKSILPPKRTSVHGITLGIIYPGPTNNCQLGLVGYVCGFFSGSTSILCGKISFYISCCLTRKPLVLIDIRSEIHSTIMKHIPPADVVLNAPYDSTSGAKMVILIFKTESMHKYLKDNNILLPVIPT